MLPVFSNFLSRGECLRFMILDNFEFLYQKRFLEFVHILTDVDLRLCGIVLRQPQTNCSLPIQFLIVDLNLHILKLICIKHFELMVCEYQHHVNRHIIYYFTVVYFKQLLSRQRSFVFSTMWRSIYFRTKRLLLHPRIRMEL